MINSKCFLKKILLWISIFSNLKFLSSFSISNDSLRNSNNFNITYSTKSSQLSIPTINLTTISIANYNITPNTTHNTIINNTNFSSITFKNTINISTSSSTYISRNVITTTNLPNILSTTIKPQFNSYLTEFKLLNLYHDKSNESFQLTYLIRTNQTNSKFSLIENYLLVNITINCTAEQDQVWSSQNENQLVTYNSLQSIASVQLKNPPKPGSFVRCFAKAQTELQILSTSIYLLIDPAAVTNLSLVRINETTLNLTWINPIYSYDSIDIFCKLNNDNDQQYSSLNLANVQIKLSKKLFKTLVSESYYLIKNLLPGANYSCFIITNRNVFNNNYSSKIESEIVSNFTDLSIPIILKHIINLKERSVNMEFNPPFGLYDNFILFLKDLHLNKVVYTENFTFQYTTNIEFNLNSSKQALLPGVSYEIWCSVYRLKTNNYEQTDLIRNAKLVRSFLIPPNPVENISVFIISNSSINVTWQPSSIGLTKKYQVKLSNQNGLIIIDFSDVNWKIFNLLNTTNDYLIEICSCSSKNNENDCESKSDIKNIVFSFERQQKVFNLTKNLKENNIEISWQIDIHDLSKFLIKLKNLKLNTSKECYLYFDYLNFDSCLWLFRCSSFNCSVKIDELNFNTKYSLDIIPFSNSGFNYESSNVLFKTKPALPEDDIQTIISYELQSKIESCPLISIQLPKIDQTNGQIIETDLFLVKLGNIKDFNQTKLFRLENTRDQEILKRIVETSQDCSNETDFMEPCLVKNYSVINFIGLEKKMLFIGNQNIEFLFNNLTFNKNENETTFEFEYENITASLIEPSSLYQLFFVFKIGDLEEKEHKNLLYFATKPSEPVQTKALNNELNMTSQNRDGLALWIVILISVISSVFLIGVIITLILLTLIKYKPSKFHKAAQFCGAGQQQNNRMGQTITLAVNGKFDRHDDYLGNSDFVVPGEFSRYEMTNIWLVKHANGDLILDEEYRNLPDFRDSKTCYASQLMKNEYKNRFLDIKAYDDSRVILDANLTNSNNFRKLELTSAEKSLLSSSISTTSNSSSSDSELLSNNPYGDYINANFVQGYSHDKKFIATQGPKKETLNDFWRMIYQYKVSAIVMLTKLVEKGVERCTQYWPDKLDITEVIGDFEITLRDQIKCGDYIKRTFDLVLINKQQINITNTPIGLSSRKIFTVNQYYYPEWPDKDTPSTDPISILHLIRDVNRDHPVYQYPIVVHCSAGVGRTGTYITLDAMMEKINTEAKIDIFGFISKIRERRQYLVQTSKQYIFIHEALYEYCLYGFTDIEVSRFVSHYKSLKDQSLLNVNGLTLSSNIRKTKLQIEFEKLCTAFYPNSQAREAFNNDNKQRNRDLNKICYDQNRIKLSSLNGSSYINATMIKGFELNNEIIITQDPMQNTQFEFWKMITEYDCNIIVALNKDFEKEKESLYWPTEENPNVKCECDDVKFSIQLVKPVTSEESNLNEFYTKRVFEIEEHKYSGSTKTIVTLFIYNEPWPEDKVPRNKSEFLELVTQVQKVAMKFDRSRIIVHAFGGGSNCSVFCALNILLYQFKNEQYVNVCRTVKKIKTQRPHLIETYEQYEFLYECLVDFVNKYGICNQSSNSFNSNSSLEESINCLKTPKTQSDVAKLEQIKFDLN